MKKIKELWEQRKLAVEEIEALGEEAKTMRSRFAKIQETTNTLAAKIERIEAEIGNEVNKEGE